MKGKRILLDFKWYTDTVLKLHKMHFNFAQKLNLQFHTDKQTEKNTYCK